jgi:single-strand DNA-binding protein
MAALNKVVLLGHLGRAPDIRATQSGKKVAALAVATSESWKDRETGERQEKTEWHRVVVFNEHLVSLAEKYLRKGSRVYLEGQLQTRKWTDTDGRDRYATEVVLSSGTGQMVLLDSRTDTRGSGPVHEADGPVMESADTHAGL